MRKLTLLLLLSFVATVSFGQKVETVYLNAKDSASNMYIAVLPQNKPAKSVLFLLDGFGASPKDVLQETDLPMYAAGQGMLTIIPVLKTGPLYFGIDSASQESLKEMVQDIVGKYQLRGKDLYMGGFSMGGGCVVKYAELAVQNNYPIKPKAIFALDPPLDWERYYKAAKRVVRLSKNREVNGEVGYMIDRIEKEMHGTPETALEHFYNLSPYSLSDTTQRAVRTLVHTPLMLITEPDIQWWLTQRGYDYDFINAADHAAMINELQSLGNTNAILVTTSQKGYREPGHKRHPHSWSIADKEQVLNWLLSQH